MNSRAVHGILGLSTTSDHLFQLYSLYVKAGLYQHEYFISQFMLSACSASVDFAKSIIDKSSVFPPLFVWNIIIRAFTNSSSPMESLKFFFQLHKSGTRPDNFTYPSIVKACGLCSMTTYGKSIHSLVLKDGLISDIFISNTLLRMYAAFKEIGIARTLFEAITHKDVVSWSSLIAACVSCEHYGEALLVFKQMSRINEKPNPVTLISLLSVCVHLMNIGIGKSIHSYTIINNMVLDVALGTALLTMYSKCGDLEKVFYVFKSMKEKNLQSWTIMISCLAAYGRGEEAYSLFTKMEQTGVRLDLVSLSVILSACSHLGLVNDGKKFFHLAVTKYKVEPTLEAFGCMVDMLGRAGMIEEAHELIENIPFKPNLVVLRSFIDSCKKYCQAPSMERNLRAMLCESETDVGANYVLAAHMVSLCGSWDEAAKLREAMRERHLNKLPGLSWVQINDGSAIRSGF